MQQLSERLVECRRVCRLEEIAGDQGHVHVAAPTEGGPKRAGERA